MANLLRRVPQIGEIYIAGTSVARGYRNNPEATAERFLADSSNPIPGSRMYRTGDLGCFLPDGQIAFQGRADSQEQIHGHRVELGEIVYALSRHPAIAGSAVVVRGHACAKNLVCVPAGAKAVKRPQRRRRPAYANSFRGIYRIIWFRPCSSKLQPYPATRTANWIVALFLIRLRRIRARGTTVYRALKYADGGAAGPDSGCGTEN